MDKAGETIVVKYGSSSVADGQGMDTRRLRGYADQLAKQKTQYGIVVVSSGAVAVGRSLWGANPNKSDQVSDQTLASIGSGSAYMAWQNILRTRGMIAGQVLVTHREIDDKKEGRTLRQAMHDNLSAGIVSVVNENDVLSDEELRRLAYGGDNDGLAAHIAIALGASHLCLLTDREGLMNGDDLIPMVTETNAQQAINLAGAEFEDRQGMKTKVSAALEVAKLGITAHIAHAGSELSAVLDGRTGTVFPNQLARVV